MVPPWHGGDLHGPRDPARAPDDDSRVRARGRRGANGGEGRLVLHAYAGADDASCDGVLYSDNGDGFGPHRVDRSVISGGDLAWKSEVGYPSPYSRVSLVLHGFANRKVTAEDAPVRVEVR